MAKSRECSHCFSTIFLTLVFLLSATGIVYCGLLSDLPLTKILFNALTKQKRAPTETSTFMNKYDYIVVGAGSGGAAVAARLSEIPCANVALFEAGDEPPLISEVPEFALFSWFSHVSWNYKSVPQKHCGDILENNQVPIPSGKMLGGSSNLNQMLYVRGNRRDYDDWAAQGATGWSYEDVLPYFKKLEDNKNREYVESGYHNTSGPVTVEDIKYTPLVKDYLKYAFLDSGYELLNSNGAKQAGLYDVQGNIRDSRRCSSAKAYLVPAEKRQNFDIVTNAIVKRILIKNQRAVGVEFDYHDKTYKVRATREVIVSAGAIRTPQLLMLSGIGPKEELDKFDIPVVADLPVGKNFHDQGALYMIYQTPKKEKPVYEKLLDPVTIIDYLVSGSGPYTGLAFSVYLAFLKGTSPSQPEDDPNFELYLGEITPIQLVQQLIGMKQEAFDAYYKPYLLDPLMMCVVTHTRPYSRGTVTLNTTNIYDQPLIDPNYLADPRDVESLLEGIKVCNKIGSHEVGDGNSFKPVTTVLPGCEDLLHDEDEYFRCFIRKITGTARHFVGSAKMGDPDDPTTVVDPQLRVKNVKGLRVADASIMPILMSGNTNIPTMMIGEKAADMIKQTITCAQECGNRNKNRKKISPDPVSTLVADTKDTVEESIQDSVQMLETILEEFLNSPAVLNRKDEILLKLADPTKVLKGKHKEDFLKLLSGKSLGAATDALKSII